MNKTLHRRIERLISEVCSDQDSENILNLLEQIKTNQRQGQIHRNRILRGFSKQQRLDLEPELLEACDYFINKQKAHFQLNLFSGGVA